MKLPDTFILRISTYDASLKGTNFNDRKSKDLAKILRTNLFEKVPCELSFAVNLHNGGRYAARNKYKMKFGFGSKYNENHVQEITLRFTRI